MKLEKIINNIQTFDSDSVDPFDLHLSVKEGEIAKAIKAIQQEIEACIGKDEHTKPIRGIENALMGLKGAYEKSIRNQLRSEIKEKLKEKGLLV